MEVTFLSYPKELGEKTPKVEKETKKDIIEMSKQAEKQVKRAKENSKKLKEIK